MNAVITDAELVAVARAYKRAERNAITATLIEQADGCDVWQTSCNGTCGSADLIDHAHQVAVWHDHRVTCDCPTTPGLICQHFAAVAAHEAFRFPEAPKTCEARGCGSSPAMFLMGGDGHHHTCPLYGNGMPYQAPAKEPTPIRKRKPSHVKSRLELQQETRPQVRLTPDGFLEARRMPCEHVVAVIAIDDEWTALPLSWDEGCSACPSSSNHAPVAVDMLPEAVGR